MPHAHVQVLISVQFSSSVTFDSLQTNERQYARLPCPSPTPGACSNSSALSSWYCPTICHPLHHLSSIFLSIKVFSNESVFHIRWPKYWSFSFSIKSFKWMFRTDLLYDGLVGSPCSPRDSQGLVHSTAQKHQFSSIQLLYGPTLTSINDYWKTHSFDQLDKVMSLAK